MLNLGNTKYKEGTYITVFLVCVLLHVICFLFVPREGVVGLVGKYLKIITILFGICGFIMAFVQYLSVRNPVTVNSYMLAGYILCGILLVLVVVSTGNMVGDLSKKGITKLELSGDSYVLETKKLSGIGARYFLVIQTPQGKTELPIQRETYEYLGTGTSVTVIYYSKMEVIQSLNDQNGKTCIMDLKDLQKKKGIPGLLEYILHVFFY